MWDPFLGVISTWLFWWSSEHWTQQSICLRSAQDNALDSLCSDSNFPFSELISNFFVSAWILSFFLYCNFLADLYSLHPNTAGSYPHFPQIHLSLPSFCDGPVPSYFLSFNIASLCAEIKFYSMWLFGWTPYHQYYIWHGHLNCSLLLLFLRHFSDSNCDG